MNISEFLPNIHYQVLSIFANSKTGVECVDGKNCGSMDIKLLRDPNAYDYVTSLSGDTIKTSAPTFLLQFPKFKSIKITNKGLFTMGHEAIPDNISGPTFVYSPSFQQLRPGVKYYIPRAYIHNFPYDKARKILIDAEHIRYDSPIFDSDFDEIGILGQCSAELVSELRTTKLYVTCDNNIQYLLTNARCKKLVLETASDLEVEELSDNIQSVITEQKKINSSVRSLLADRCNRRFVRTKPVY